MTISVPVTLVTVAMLALTGCAPAAKKADAGLVATPVQLLDHGRWREGGPSVDPFPDHRPALVSCATGSWAREGETLEANTEWCNYILITQPLAHALASGQQLRVIFWHATLTAPQPAVAHAAIAISGKTIWERQIPIPQEAASYEDVVTVPLAIAVDAPIVYHLHNHGGNVWNLNKLELRP